LSSEFEVFYFGDLPNRLFGCYHSPTSSPPKSSGIVLCYPMGQEYIRSHRIYHQLAVRLAKIGFHVLRFDYFGSGDSSGNFEKAGLQIWIKNIVEAVNELKYKSKLQRFGFIGLRLGASLSLVAAEICKNINTIILWEPVIKGEIYIEELIAEQHQYVSNLPKDVRNLYTRNTTFNEVLGFPITKALSKELARLDLYSSDYGNNSRVLIVSCEENDQLVKLRKHLSRSAEMVDYEIVPDHKLWLEEPYKAIVPVQTLEKLSSWIDKWMK